MANPYKKGRRFEWRVRDYLRSHHVFVVRQAKSAFPDLICLVRGVPYFIECKLRGGISPDERQRLCDLAAEHDGFPMLARKSRTSNGIVIELLRPPNKKKGAG